MLPVSRNGGLRSWGEFQAPQSRRGDTVSSAVDSQILDFTAEYRERVVQGNAVSQHSHSVDAETVQRVPGAAEVDGVQEASGERHTRPAPALYGQFGS